MHCERLVSFCRFTAESRDIFQTNRVGSVRADPKLELLVPRICGRRHGFALVREA